MGVTRSWIASVQTVVDVPGHNELVHHDAVTHIVHHDAEQIWHEPYYYTVQGQCANYVPEWWEDIWNEEYQDYDSIFHPAYWQNVPCDQAILHDGYWETVSPAWDETVVDEAAWDEQVWVPPTYKQVDLGHWETVVMVTVTNTSKQGGALMPYTFQVNIAGQVTSIWLGAGASGSVSSTFAEYKSGTVTLQNAPGNSLSF